MWCALSLACNPTCCWASRESKRWLQRSGGRVDQHEHGDGIFDDGAQADVRHREGENREQDGPGLVADLAVRHLGKCLPAGRDKTDGGLEAGKGDGDGRVMIS